MILPKIVIFMSGYTLSLRHPIILGSNDTIHLQSLKDTFFSKLNQLKDIVNLTVFFFLFELRMFS